MWWQQLKATDYIGLALISWLAILSFFLIRTIGHYRKIARGAKNQNLGQILEDIIDKQNLTTKQISEILTEIVKIEKAQKKNFSKYALLRYNPFEDTGGDQSFAIALLDSANDGLVISSLHSRGDTRVYAKKVTGAKAASHQFSKEEKEVVEKAAHYV